MQPPLSPITRSATSFRDPGGRLIQHEGRVVRFVAPGSVSDLEGFLVSATVERFGAAGNLVASRRMDPAEGRAWLAKAGAADLGGPTEAALFLEHERIPFPSFPYEWPPEMLHAAGALTLDLSESLLAEGLGLKDATPYNIVFRGPQPVFVDVLSFERRAPGDPTWLPYAQFVRTFLLPLLVTRQFGLPLDTLLTTSRDGLEPEQVYRMCGWGQKLRPSMLALVTLPTWLAAWHREGDPALYRPRRLPDSEKARFILASLFKSLRRHLHRLAPTGMDRSAWSDYAAQRAYTADEAGSKQEFVQAALAEFRPKRLLDVGCNTGEFSFLAAAGGAEVVAIDSDPVVVGEVWRRARGSSRNVLPLVVNLARPSPAVGWRNQECLSFLERARGQFDTVLMLALLHHLLVSERVLLDDVFDMAADLTRDLLVIEYVDPADPMFRRITRGRDHLHAGFSREVFEAAGRRRFRLLRSQRVGQANRWLYLFRKT
ncbi:MAG: methyltransferase domain-containing protein [Acidobacteria bacterium]|nr:methyltransferase domain-containing protein [Acidobacteriota bacterium]